MLLIDSGRKETKFPFTLAILAVPVQTVLKATSFQSQIVFRKQNETLVSQRVREGSLMSSFLLM